MYSLRVRIGVVVAFALAMVASSAQAADGVVLRYKSKKGEKRYYATKTDLKMTQTIREMNLKTTFQTESTAEVEATESTDKGNLVVRQRTMKYLMKADLPIIGKYEYDSTSSDNDSAGQLSAILTPVNDAISGAIVDVTFSKLGKVVKVKGIQDALKGVVEQTPGSAQFTGGAHTDEGAKLAFEEQFITFPEKALEDGDTWEKPLKMKLPSVGSFEGKVVYKYEGVEKVKGRNLHKITFTNDMSIDVNQKTNGANVTGTLEITASSGTAYFDAERGVIVSKVAEVTVGGNLTIEAGGQNIALAQDQTQKSSSKLLDGPPKE
jgi:hypothetical protein